MTKKPQNAVAQIGSPLIFLILLVSFGGRREQTRLRVSQDSGFPLPFLKIKITGLFVCVYVCAYMSLCEPHVCPEKGVGSSGPGVRVDCEPTNMGAGN